MIKAMVAYRVHVLLGKLAKLSEEELVKNLEKANSQSAIEKAKAGMADPDMLKRYLAIQNELKLLNILFGDS